MRLKLLLRRYIQLLSKTIIKNLKERNKIKMYNNNFDCTLKSTKLWQNK